jgi:hypothetical protein
VHGHVDMRVMCPRRPSAPRTTVSFNSSFIIGIYFEVVSVNRDYFRENSWSGRLYQRVIHANSDISLISLISGQCTHDLIGIYELLPNIFIIESFMQPTGIGNDGLRRSGTKGTQYRAHLMSIRTMGDDIISHYGPTDYSATIRCWITSGLDGLGWFG